MPSKSIDLFKAVKKYEAYVRNVRKLLLEGYYRRAHHRQTALYLTHSALENLGLPGPVEDELHS